MISCKHPKNRIKSREASYTNEEYVYFIGWEYYCSKCMKASRFISGLRSLGCPDYFEYELFTGRKFEQDFEKAIERANVRKARQQIKEAQGVLKRAGVKR